MIDRCSNAERWVKRIASAAVLSLGVAACGTTSSEGPLVSPQSASELGYNTQLLLDCVHYPTAKVSLPPIDIQTMSEPEAFIAGPKNSRQQLVVKVLNMVNSDVVLDVNDEKSWPTAPDKITISRLHTHKMQKVEWPHGNYELQVRMNGKNPAPRLTVGAACDAALK